MVGCGFVRRFCGVRNNQTSPGLRGIEKPNLSTTETVWVAKIREGVPCCNLFDFLLKSKVSLS